MAHLKEYGLSKKLKKIEEEELPTIEKIETENKILQKKEKAFEKKFKLQEKKHASTKKTRR